ncbi:nitrilase family protein [Deminuibacter soli]|uniref:Omega-amidase YafV n=1 Tax=Deminuibacter soli TaxID=2291815 RepID=A0A3E1NR71_9BACT|nr:nitrilase family protein [Deminuibacter soli]RFM30278.1 nitrilase family protein [Deminuibacter soli]
MSSLSLTLIQTALYWEDKKANLAMLEQKINSITGKPEIVVLPEMFSTGFSMQPALLAEPMNGPTVKWMKRVAAQKKIVLTGSVIIEEGGLYYNRLIWMLPNGQYGIYNKRHLFAYGKEDQYYTPGNKRLIASVKGWRIQLQVCYDLRFPVWARQSMAAVAENGGATVDAGPEYDVLIYVANWPERRKLAWKTLLQARAIENQCFVAGLNRVGNDGNNIAHSGDSMVIDPLGEILYHKENDEDIYTITLQKTQLDETRNRFPFWRDADYFNILHV